MVQVGFDYTNKGELWNLFKNKKVHSITKYIKVLAGLDQRMKSDKKLIKQIFDDHETYGTFLKDNLKWILEKSKHEFSKDDIIIFLDVLQRTGK